MDAPTPITISQACLDALVRERIAAALPDHVVRAIARQIVRKRLAVVTLEEARRFLKWKTAEALRQKLRRAGVRAIKTTAHRLTYAIDDLIKFRESCRQAKASPRGRRLKVMDPPSHEATADEREAA